MIISKEINQFTPVNSEPERFRRPLITLESQNMVLDLILVVIKILVGTILVVFVSPLLTTPAYYSESSFRDKSELLEKPQCLPTGNNTTSIVVRARLGPCVPTVDVTSKQNYLVVLAIITPLYLSYEVIRTDVPGYVIHQCQVHNDPLATILHSLKHVCVFDCDRGCADQAPVPVIVDTRMGRVD